MKTDDLTLKTFERVDAEAALVSAEIQSYMKKIPSLSPLWHELNVSVMALRSHSANGLKGRDFGREMIYKYQQRLFHAKVLLAALQWNPLDKGEG